MNARVFLSFALACSRFLSPSPRGCCVGQRIHIVFGVLAFVSPWRAAVHCGAVHAARSVEHRQAVRCANTRTRTYPKPPALPTPYPPTIKSPLNAAPCTTTLTQEMDWLRMLERVLKLSIPTIYVWLCIFYCVFHCWLNILGELLRFGDRGFYREW